MNFKVFNFFKKRQPGLQEQVSQVVEEIKVLRRQLSKQNFQLEAVKNEIIKAIVEEQRPGIEPYCEVADTLFYYEAALQASDQANPEQLEALEIIWEKIDTLMSLAGLQILRRAGGDFDSRLYEAMENQGDGAGELVVLQVLQPGYVFNHMVIRPAKVVVGKINQSEG